MLVKLQKDKAIVIDVTILAIDDIFTAFASCNLREILHNNQGDF